MASLFKNFYVNVSPEEHKTNYRCLSIPGTALSNQSDIAAFFSPWEVNLEIRLIPGDDLVRMAQYWKNDKSEWSI